MDLVGVDSNVFVWGVKRVATQGQEHMIARTAVFLDYLDKSKTRIILPAPIITEVLAPVDLEADRRAFMDIIYKRFRIAPVDDVAAQIGAEIWNKNKNKWKEFYEQGGDGLKNRFKYDLLILSVAMAQNVKCLYTEDKGLANLSNANGLKAHGIPDIGVQANLLDAIQEVGSEEAVNPDF